MFNKILIANRGEIACRVARTARRLGVATVAVYSEADANAMHVALCDEAYLIGPAAATESYLCPEKILRVAKQSGAEAVHPGYGFLSENAAFSKACAAEGIVFIGPPADAITAMGSKSHAKALMGAAEVPLVPGYHGDEQSPEFLKAEAEKVGYPLLIKASAGGGGKGMRVVESVNEFDEALASACRESKAAFGDDKMLLERYLTAPRHVELQIFADTHGNALHLFERDCSIQRRHQKVLEEAPAPGMTEALRGKMGTAAVNAAKAIGYVGAGTVEFLLDSDGSFFFMEMNTRLQVEHPVTEMISGQDLVEWQLRVASGEPMPLTQSELQINGHAIEVRVYAEIPERDFLPATGTLTYLKIPEESAHVRVDTGVCQGDEVSVHYDPMIAKLIVWGQNRASALRRLRSALMDYRIAGVGTNLEFLSTLCALPALANAELDTGFIDKRMDQLFAPESSLPNDVVALAVLAELLREQAQALTVQQRSADPFSPWGLGDGWRMNQDNHQSLIVGFKDEFYPVIAHFRANGFELAAEDIHCSISGEISAEGELSAEVDGRRLRATVIRQGHDLTLLHQGKSWHMVIHDPRLEALEGEGEGGGLTAPMPGSVVALHVSKGDEVKAGDSLIVVEAMKMEHTITASVNGIVKEINFAVGDQVEDGDELLVIE